MTTRILVAGIGNIFLGDDGFGSEVVRNAELPQDDPTIQVIDYGIRGMHLAYDLLEEWDTLVLVDAVPSRGNPGTLHVFQADHESSPEPNGLDAHSMDPAAVFASLRALGGQPALHRGGRLRGGQRRGGHRPDRTGRTGRPPGGAGCGRDRRGVARRTARRPKRGAEPCVWAYRDR